MIRKFFTSAIAVIFAAVLIVSNNPADAQERARSGRAIDENKRVELRIDRLTMVIADKSEEGMDTSRAEDLLVDAIELFESGRLDEAMEKMDEVEKSLGLEPKRFERRDNPDDRFFGNRSGIDGKQPPPPFFKKELSKEDKEKMLGEIKRNLSKTQKLIESGKYEEAFKMIGDAHRKLGAVAGIHPPRPDQGFGGMMGPGGSMRFGDHDGMRPRDQMGQNMRPGIGQGMMPQDGRGLEFLFKKAREKGPEGFDRLADFFKKITARMDEKGVEYNKESIKVFEEAVKLKKADNLDKAFDKMHEAFTLIHESTKEAFDKFRHNMQDRRSPYDKPKIDPETAKEVKKVLYSLKKTAEKYVEKHGKDEFINSCFKDFKKLEQRYREGQISKEKAIEEAKKLQKRIEKKL